jgi:hypothetical protein
MRHLTAIAYHRNGICGVPFHVVLFRDGKESMLGIQFENDEDHANVYTAVLNVAKLATGDIAFASNSYRGDHFHAQIAVWSEMYEAERSAEAESEKKREARAQEIMKKFAEEEAIKYQRTHDVYGRPIVNGFVETDMSGNKRDGVA